MVHCGYDPSGALGTSYQSGDHWKNFKYNFSPRPKPYTEGHRVNAFNGFSAGQGHLAEARAALQAPATKSAAAAGTGRPKAQDGTFCGNEAAAAQPVGHGPGQVETPD
jgi:hypothetical protein